MRGRIEGGSRGMASTATASYTTERRFHQKRRKYLGKTSEEGDEGRSSYNINTMSTSINLSTTAKMRKRRAAERRLQRIQDQLQDLEEGPNPNDPSCREAVVALSLGKNSTNCI